MPNILAKIQQGTPITRRVGHRQRGSAGGRSQASMFSSSAKDPPIQDQLPDQCVDFFGPAIFHAVLSVSVLALHITASHLVC